MRIPKFLSPSSIDLFYKDRSEFYLKYLADNRPPKIPQTRPMSIGSAFDAFAKSYMAKNLFGEVRPQFEARKIFEEQVEPQNRDWAWENGMHVFGMYLKNGAMGDLMLELEAASEEPRFEFTVEDRVTHSSSFEGVPLLGKPDVYFKTKDGYGIVYDFKVNGYCSKGNTSPKPGYVWLRDSGGKKPAHKKALPLGDHGGIQYNTAQNLEDIDEQWATQLAIYGWLLGEPICSEFLTGIEQIVGKETDDKPSIRCASHRVLVSCQFQQVLFERIKHAWTTIHSGHIFDNLTKEESDKRCAVLDDYHKAFGGEQDDWFQEVTR